MAINLSPEQRSNYLRDEYLFLQGQYEDYDKRSLTIKGWVSSGATAALAIAFNTSYKLGLFLPILVAIMVGVIWYLEACWKLFQYALADRIRIIEAHFRNDPQILFKDPEPFQTYNWWFRSYVDDEPIFEYEKSRPQPYSLRFRKAAFQKFVFLPYVPILFLSLASFFVLLVALLVAPLVAP
jgi:hypothetical protein